jgi:hypothetical protein
MAMPVLSPRSARPSIRLLIALSFSCFCFAQSGSGRPLEVSCSPESAKVQAGQSVKIRANTNSSENNLIYSFGSDGGTITVKGNEATLSTALLGPGAATVHVICSVLTMGGQIAHANIPISLLAASTPSVPLGSSSEPTKSFSGTIAPTLSWIASTQTQRVLGGNAAVGFLNAKEYCDPHAWQIGAEGMASNSTTQKPGSSATHINSDDARINGLAAIGRDKGDPRDYVGGTADFFLNNSLGIGLQQTYTAEYRHYFMACPDVTIKKTIKQSLAFGAGVGYTSERLYKTVGTVTSPVTPLSAQYSWSWWGNVPKKGDIPASP